MSVHTKSKNQDLAGPDGWDEPVTLKDYPSPATYRGRRFDRLVGLGLGAAMPRFVADTSTESSTFSDHLALFLTHG